MFVWPQEGESISSWIYRVASAHNTSMYEFLRRNRQPFFWKRDLDLHPNINFLNKMVTGTPLDYTDLYEMTLESYVLRLSEKNTVNSLKKWVLPVGSFSFKNPYPRYQFCVVCEDKYFKKFNRLIISCICLFCGAYLHSSCTICRSPVIFSYNHTQFKKIDAPITECYECGKAIYLNKAEVRFSSLQEYQFQWVLKKLIENYKDSQSVNDNKRYLNQLYDTIEKSIMGISNKSNRVKSIQLLTAYERMQLFFNFSLYSQ